MNYLRQLRVFNVYEREILGEFILQKSPYLNLFRNKFGNVSSPMVIRMSFNESRSKSCDFCVIGVYNANRRSSTCNCAILVRQAQGLLLDPTAACAETPRRQNKNRVGAWRGTSRRIDRDKLNGTNGVELAVSRRVLLIFRFSWDLQHFGGADFCRKPQILAENRKKV